MQLVTVNIWEASEYDKRGELKRQAEAVNREISIEGPVVGERRCEQFTTMAVTALTALPLWRQFM